MIHLRQKSTDIGNDPLLWSTEKDFRADVKTAMEEFRELVKKRAGLGTGGAWTIITV